jgi:hypothetical protein
MGLRAIMLEPRCEFEAKALRKALTLIRTFKQDWVGRVVDDEGLIHIAHEDGRNPPLIWCFNDGLPFARLAEALGPDQPLIGLRSGHMVARTQNRSTGLDFQIADHYYAVLRTHFPDTSFFIGGNCQGATIAGRLKECFVLDGIPVRGAFHMESANLQPFAGRQIMLFGDQSYAYNPYLKGEAPEAVWQAMFPTVEFHALPGGHGSYFSPDTVGNLSAIIADVVASTGEGEPRRAPGDIRVDFDRPDAAAVTDAGLALRLTLSSQIPLQTAVPDRLRVYALWHCLERLDACHQLIDVSSQSFDSPFTCQLELPEPGRWGLTLYPVRIGDGPLDIAAARQRSVELVVPEPSEPLLDQRVFQEDSV